jgi:hypothetical protein
MTAVLAVLAACSGGPTPQPTPIGPTAEVTAAVGTYLLVSIDQTALPTVTVTTPCLGFTDSGRMSLSATATFVIVLEAHFVCANGPGPVHTTTDAGEWSLRGAEIILAQAPRFGGNALRFSDGTLTGSTVTISFEAPSYGEGIPPRRVTSVWRKS